MTHSLVPVGIVVAPIPVVPVRSGARSVELVIDAVLCHQVAPVSAILTVIPIMVVTVVSIVISDVVVIRVPVALISGLGYACR
jgi:hypothetical protein